MNLKGDLGGSMGPNVVYLLQRQLGIREDPHYPHVVEELSRLVGIEIGEDAQMNREGEPKTSDHPHQTQIMDLNTI